jgi:hypothetical protein
VRLLMTVTVEFLLVDLSLCFGDLSIANFSEP